MAARRLREVSLPVRLLSVRLWALALIEIVVLLVGLLLMVVVTHWAAVHASQSLISTAHSRNSAWVLQTGCHWVVINTGAWHVQNWAGQTSRLWRP